MIYPLDKKHVDFYVEAILRASKEGTGMEVFLYDMHIRKSAWDKYQKKHKKIRLAMNDANHFTKAFALLKVESLIKNKDINSTIAKMYLEECAGWGVSVDLESATTPTVIIKVGKTNKEKEK